MDNKKIIEELKSNLEEIRILSDYLDTVRHSYAKKAIIRLTAKNKRLIYNLNPKK